MDKSGLHMGFRSRMLLWIPTLSYEGFLLSGGKEIASLAQVATASFLGATMGFLMASMFTIRQSRRDRRRSSR
jgi:hypothetical protein